MTIAEFTKILNEVPKKFRIQLNARLTPVINDIAMQMVRRSPFDTGYFANRWRVRKVFTKSGIKYTIENKTANYGIFLEEGAEPGGVPWGWPSGDSGGTISKSGKLAVINSRVWAGGKSPSGFVAGGIIDPILMHTSNEVANKNQERIAEAAANSFMASL